MSTRRRIATGLLVVAASVGLTAGLGAVPAAGVAPTNGGPATVHAAGPATGPATVRAAAPTEEPLPTDESVAVLVRGLTPRVVRPGTELRIGGELVNRTDTEFSDLRVRLEIRTTPVVSRSELAELATTDTALGVVAAEVDVSDSMPAHGHAAFRLTVPADELGLGTFGVYPIAVAAVARDAISIDDPVGRTPTFLPWVPAERGAAGFLPTRIAWVWPLLDVPDRSAEPAFPDDHLAASVTTGRLHTILGAAAAVAPDAVTPPEQPTQPAKGKGKKGKKGRGQRVRPPADAQRGVPLTIAVDPALLQSVADMADGYQVDDPDGSRSHAGQGQAAARAWLTQLRAALSPGSLSGRGPGLASTVLSLPYADVDVTALRRYGLRDDVVAALDRGRAIVHGIVGSATTDSLGWLPDGYVTHAAITLLVEQGVTGLVLADAALPLSESLTYTPTGVARLPGSAGTGTAYLIDPTLAQIVAATDRSDLRTARDAATAPAPSTNPTSSPTSSPTGNPTTSPTSTTSPSPFPSATATPSPGAPVHVDPAGLVGGVATARLVEQRFLVETALITAERPIDQRSIVVAAPREWDPDPTVAAALAADTGRVPWLRGVTLPRTDIDPDVGRVDLSYPEGAEQNELSHNYLAAPGTGVRAIRRRFELFRSILQPPIGATATSLDNATLRTESSAWRADRAAGYELRDTVGQQLDDEQNAVAISSSQRVITLASRRGEIPITISNELDQAVVVRLQVAADSARVSAEDRTVHTVEAQRKVTEQVTAVVNQAGLFSVTAQLLTPDGRPYGDPVQLRLRSTAYGDLALGITGGALAVLFIAVIVRLIRRTTRARRTAA